jgi:SAM-dependent methyltransferase
LFLISLLILFLELACIRWFPAHVLFLTFFTNVVLLASFLGMSLGCLAAGRTRNYLTWTPFLLGLALAAAHGVERLRNGIESILDVGHQASPQLVFFGTEYHSQDSAHFLIPMEAICGFFFLVLTLAMVGPGQELGRAFRRVPDRLRAYTLNILGSLAGIALFAGCSWCRLSPLWWFFPIALGLGYFLFPGRFLRWLLLGAAPAAVVWLACLNSGPYVPKNALAGQHLWSPYYRIDYQHLGPSGRSIDVNLIGHQRMISRREPYPAYALPHLLNRDTGGKPYADVLIIGAGSGNDVSRALQWGAARVDAVEIDPVIYRLGREHHPDHPYQDLRVRVHLDDGRNFLRRSKQQYDLIVYALVDSLVLHSGYSNIRLESYLFTKEAFADVRRHLKPGGQFFMYNYFRQGWIVARLQQGLAGAFGNEPLVLSLPYRDTIRADDVLFGNFTVFVAGDTGRLAGAFSRRPAYWLAADEAAAPGQSPNGFQQLPGPGQENHYYHFGLAKVVPPPTPLKMAADDWPFLYLRAPMIPDLSLRGMAVMGGIAVVLLFLFLPKARGEGGRWSFDGRMFFLGAGFMLVETKAVVHMALLFGSTWMVNSIVFAAVLVMILAANLFVGVCRPAKLWPYYAGLLATLAANALLPLDFFLGMDRTVQILASCLLVSAPILFAGVIFAVSFTRSSEPDRAFGANVAGAMLGGLAEYSSMLLGFQHLVLVGLGFYALSMVLGSRSQPAATGAASMEPSKAAA